VKLEFLVDFVVVVFLLLLLLFSLFLFRVWEMFVLLTSRREVKE